MTKKLRQQVYDKFGGLCAYSGKPLDEKWQVDHMVPRIRYRWNLVKGDPHHLDNLLPALRIVNHYKRDRDLESWRFFLLKLHERLRKLPKKTSRPATISRSAYLRQVAAHFEISEDKPFSGVFYFETIK